MKHYINEGKEILKRKKVRLYRSRQGKSDERYSRDMKLFTFSFVCLVLTLLLILFTQ